MVTRKIWLDANRFVSCEVDDRILKLMEDNMGEIKRRYGQRKVA